MLLDFTVGNFGPFRDDATLSMQATSVSEHPENILDSEGYKGDILSSAIIFGSNASGKSYLIDAMVALRKLLRAVDDTGFPGSCYNPYRLTESSRESPVRLRIRLVLDGILYDYRVEFTSDSITKESLFHYPNRRPSRVFVREGAEFTGGKKRIAGMTSANRTYLAMASVSSDPLCSKVRAAILNDIIILFPDLDRLVQESCSFGADDPGKKAKMVRGLCTADLGIDDFNYNERTMKLADVKMKIPPELYEKVQKESDTFTTRDIFLRHGFTAPGIDDEGRTMPLDFESAGTWCMFGLMGPLLDALENGKVLMMDELGAHLHPMLTRWIVRQFSADDNPNGAQLIANTHDIGLMDIDRLLRRDQIWFVNKGRADGASELYCLSDFDGVRKDTDVLRRYLDGRFDAVPAVRHRGVI